MTGGTGLRLRAHGFPVAVVASVAGGGLAAVASGQAWLHGPAVAAAPGGRVSGSLAVPLALAAGLVGLAAAGGLLGTAGVARRGLGGLVAALAAAGCGATVLALARPVSTYRSAVLGAAAPQAGTAVTPTAWPVLALAGLLAVLAAAILTVVDGGRWPRLGRRYERRSGARPDGTPSPRVGPAADWDALDAGYDPTDEPGRTDEPTDDAPRSAPGLGAPSGSATVGAAARRVPDPHQDPRTE